MQTDTKPIYDINSNWENIDWKEKFKLPFDRFFDNKDINPWKIEIESGKSIKEDLSIKYIEGHQNFSWIFPWDKKLLSSGSVSQNFGMPTQISGNFENANLYLCLFNPSIPNKNANSSENKDIDLKTYIDNEYEDAISKEEYERAKKNNTFVIDIWHKNNVVYDELEHIISLIKKDHNKDALSVFKNIVDNKHWTKKDKDKGYYIYTYYNVLLKDQLINLAKEFPCGDSPDFDKIHFNDVNKELKSFKNLKICNVELFPYRDDKQGRINLKKDYPVINISVVRFIILLILKRIYDYKHNNKEKPIFIVRTWTNKKQCGYFDAIKEFFEKIDSSNTDRDIEDIKKYFLITRSPQNGKISSNNLMNVNDYEEFQKAKDKCFKDMSGIIDKIQQSI